MQTGLERENKNPAAVRDDRAGWSIFFTPGSVPAVVNERSEAIPRVAQTRDPIRRLLRRFTRSRAPARERVLRGSSLAKAA
jgi:hypothetical protein